MQNIEPRTAYWMLVATQFLWASALIVARGVHELIPPIAFSFWRWIAAALIMAPFALPLLRKSWPQLQSKLPRTIALGFFLAIGSTGLVWAVQFTTATNASLVAASQPVVTAIVAWIVLKDRLTILQLCGVISALIGIVIMVARLDVEIIRHLDFNPGDAIMLGSVVFYAFYTINLHRWLGGTHPLLMLFLAAVTGSIFLIPCVIFEAHFVGTPTLVWPSIGAVLYMAVVPTVLATTMWNASIGAVGPNKATIFLNLLPVFGVLLGVLLLGETLYHYHIIGGLFVCAGISLMVRRA
ncbi:MAG: DMT family transporter [Pseudomonadota bacterium]